MCRLPLHIIKLAIAAVFLMLLINLVLNAALFAILYEAFMIPPLTTRQAAFVRNMVISLFTIFLYNYLLLNISIISGRWNMVLQIFTILCINLRNIPMKLATVWKLCRVPTYLLNPEALCSEHVPSMFTRPPQTLA
jgi:hypothetical protein